MAAVLACGPEAALSHGTAAALYGLLVEAGAIHVSVPMSVNRRVEGVRVHRRAAIVGNVARWRGIPVATPVLTLIDIAANRPAAHVERAVNQADARGLVDAEAVRRELEAFARVPGVAALRRTLDRRTFTLTDSELERRFLPIARRAGLPAPETQARLNGFRVDFLWPALGLVVETDGLRYHRTPAQQARDRLRDQAHTAAGLTCLRFTHDQVARQPAHVEAVLRATAARLTRTA